jgi:flagellin
MNAQRNTATSQNSLSTAMQRLSSGLRVNSAKDDAAGLAIGNRMDAQARGRLAGACSSALGLLSRGWVSISWGMANGCVLPN